MKYESISASHEKRHDSQRLIEGREALGNASEKYLCTDHGENQLVRRTIRSTEKISWFGGQSDPLAFAEPVITRLGKIFRFRIGGYRALFRLEEGTMHLLVILAVRHRKEAYNKF